MSLARHTASGLIAYGLPLAAGVATIPLHLRLLGVEAYGIFVLLLALLNYAAFLDLGGGKAAAFYIARLRANLAPTSSFSVAGGTALCLLVCVPIVTGLLILRDPLAQMLPDVVGVRAGEVMGAIVMTALCVPLMAMMSLYTGVYQGQLKFFRLNAIQAVSGMALQILPVMLCWLIAPRLDVAFAAVLLVRLGTVAAMVASAGSFRPRLVSIATTDRKSIADILRFGRWPAAMNLLASVITSGDRFVISHLSGAGAVAAYVVPFDLANRMMIVAGSVANTLFPSLAGDSAGAADKTRAVSTAVIALLTPLTVALILALDPFLRLWVGEELALDARMVGELILAGVWATAIAALAQARLMAADRGSVVVVSYAFQFPLFFLAVYILTSNFGLVGAAAAWAIRCYIDAIVMPILGKADVHPMFDVWHHGLLIFLAVMAAAPDTSIIIRAILIAVFLGTSTFISRNTIKLVFQRLRVA